jgi:hypothetical protein
MLSFSQHSSVAYHARLAGRSSVGSSLLDLNQPTHEPQQTTSATCSRCCAGWRRLGMNPKPCALACVLLFVTCVIGHPHHPRSMRPCHPPAQVHAPGSLTVAPAPAPSGPAAAASSFAITYHGGFVGPHGNLDLRVPVTALPGAQAFPLSSVGRPVNCQPPSDLIASAQPRFLSPRPPAC